MSLINDALKRVSEAERGKPAQQTDFETRSLQPAEYERRSSPALWIMLPVLLVVVGVGGFLLAKQKQTQPVAGVETKASPQQPVGEPAKASIPVATVPEAELKAATGSVTPAPAVAHAMPAQPAATTSISTNLSKAANATPAPTASAAPAPAQPAPAPAPTGPTFQLKGILYTKNPTALINDGSVEVGGEIDGAKVTKIDRTSVELEYQGKVTVLKLGARK